jgi:hypothetical protein
LKADSFFRALLLSELFEASLSYTYGSSGNPAGVEELRARSCVARAEASQSYVDTLRAAIINGDYD